MMQTIPKVSAEKNSGLQDDHDPNDIGQRTANKKQQSQKEGPAAYTPHDEGEVAYPDRGPTKKEDGRILMADENLPEKRPGPFAQDRSRTSPTKEQRDKDYQSEKRETGAAIKRQGKDDLGFPPDDESKFG
jgi:hypothetical protein